MLKQFIVLVITNKLRIHSVLIDPEYYNFTSFSYVFVYELIAVPAVLEWDRLLSSLLFSLYTFIFFLIGSLENVCIQLIISLIEHIFKFQTQIKM